MVHGLDSLGRRYKRFCWLYLGFYRAWFTGCAVGFWGIGVFAGRSLSWRLIEGEGGGCGVYKNEGSGCGAQ